MKCIHPIFLKSSPLVPVPCGKCPACLANRRQEWVTRLKAELSACAFGLFVTFTYDDQTVPFKELVDVDTGELFQYLCFAKRDVQLFLKRLRKSLPERSLRYFIVGEFGDNTHRPHYHGLLFFNNQVKKDGVLYDKITNSWQNGFVQFGDAEPASIAYCTKYCLKQSFVPFHRSGLGQDWDKGFKPFILASRRPAIGSVVLTDKVKMHMERGDFGSIRFDGTFVRTPRLFRDKYFNVVPEAKQFFNQYTLPVLLDGQEKQVFSMAKKHGKEWKYRQENLKEKQILLHVKKQTL